MNLQHGSMSGPLIHLVLFEVALHSSLSTAWSWKLVIPA
jgi:hypothetical protein